MLCPVATQHAPSAHKRIPVATTLLPAMAPKKLAMFVPSENRIIRRLPVKNTYTVFAPIPRLERAPASYYLRAMLKKVLCSAIVASVLTMQPQTTSAPFDYPKAKKVDQVDDYHGTKVADPYRWLENPDSPESRQWIEAQNKITFDFLGKIPEREKIKQRLTELWNYERFGVPFKEGNRYFISERRAAEPECALHNG